MRKRTGVRIIYLGLFFGLSLGGSHAWAVQEGKGQEPGEENRQDDPLEDMYFDERVIFERIPEVVTPTKTKRPLRRAPAAVSVLTGDQLFRLGWPTLSDAMRSIPGTEVMRTFSTESNVAFRGFFGPSGTSSGVLLLVDGRQTYLDLSGENNWDNLPIALEDIDRVEIIRGPGSFLYGPNALHGVVNVITRRPSDMVREGEEYAIGLSTTLGSDHTVISSMRGAYREDDWGVRMTLGWNDVGSYSDHNERIKEMGFGNFIFRQDFREDHGWELHAGFHAGKYNTVRSGNIHVDLQRGYGMFHYWLDGLKIQLVYDQMVGDVSNLVIPLIPGDGSTGVNRAANLDVHYTTEWELSGPHTTIIGAGLIYNRSGFDELTGGMETQWRPAVYLQDEWSLLEDFFLTYGLRLDDHPESGLDLSPQVALLWLLDEDHALRASVKRGFRTPSNLESFLDFLSDPIPPTLVQIQNSPSPDLSSENMLSFEAGYSGLLWDRMKVGVDFFYNRIDDIINLVAINAATAPPLGIEIRQFRNDRDAEVFGVEISTDMLVTDNISLWGNVSVQRAEYRDTGDPITGAPESKGNLGIRASFPSERLFADIWLNYFGEVEIEGPPNVPYDERWMLNARVAWSFWDGRAEIWASLVNINDDRHFEHPQGEELGRAFYVGFQVK